MVRKIKKKLEKEMFVVWIDGSDLDPNIFFNREDMLNFIGQMAIDFGAEKLEEELLRIVRVKDIWELESIKIEGDSVLTTFNQVSAESYINFMEEYNEE
jgi:hypothetical protein